MRAALAVAVIVTLAPAAHAAHPEGNDASVRLAVGGYLGSDCEWCGPDRSLGLSLRPLFVVSAIVRLGAHFEGQWYADDDDEHDASELRAAVILQLRATRRLGVEFGLGIVRYHGAFDRPGSPGCLGCGSYDGQTFAPTLEVSASYAYPIGGPLSVDVGGGFLFRKNLAYGSDVHNFMGPGLSIHAEVGLALAF